MAVKPNDVIHHVCEKDNDVLWQLEAAIDQELPNHIETIKAGEPVLFKIGPNISNNVRKLVVERYQSHGWAVEIIQARGGECFRFTRSTSLLNAVEDTLDEVLGRAKKFFNRLTKDEHDKAGKTSQ